MTLAAVETMIHGRTGLTFDVYRLQVLEEAVALHMTALQVDDVKDYLHLLQLRDDCFNDLVDRLTINESYFFRESAHLDLLCRRMVPARMEKSKTEKIVIVSAGCSTGEEPCSIAMALEQAYGPGVFNRVAVSGMDIDHTALALARTGVYGKRKLRQLAPGMLTRYFDAVGDAYAVKSSLLNHISYFQFNLMTPPGLEKIASVDILFYRNVSIYFDAPTRMKVFRNLAKMLKSGGYLVVGSTETMSHDTGHLSLREMDGCFVYQKTDGALPGMGRRVSRPPAGGPCGCTDSHELFPSRSPFPGVSSRRYRRSGETAGGPARYHIPFSPGRSRSRTPEPGGRTTPVSRKEECRTRLDGVSKMQVVPHAATYQDALELARRKRFDAALNLLRTLGDAPADMVEKAGLLRACLIYQQGDAKKAVALCRTLIQENVRCASAYLLWGIIEQTNQRHQECLKRFRETLYIEPANWAAHFFMFQAFRELGDAKAANRQAAVLVRLLESGKGACHALEGLFFSFSMDDILEVCRRHLSLTA